MEGEIKTVTLSVMRKVFVLIWGVMFVIAPLFVQRNFGGRGLELPFNISVWFFIVLLICLGIFKVLKTSKYISSSYSYFLLLFPVFIISMFVIRGAEDQIGCVFRLLFILTGVLFVFSLFQFKLTEKNINAVLMVIVIAGIVQSMVGVAQIYAPSVIENFFPTGGGRPEGVFQQRNALATFLASSIISGVFVCTRPYMAAFNLFSWVLVYLCFAICGFVLALSGSKVAMLGLIMALLIMLVMRIGYMRKNKKAVVFGMAILAVSLFVGSIANSNGNSAIARFASDSESVFTNPRSSIRVNLYAIASELIAKRPLVGHGLGSFQKQWSLQTGDYIKRYPEANIDGHQTHPHNEIAYWAIEMGVGVLVVAIAVFVVIAVQIKRCGVQRGGGYFALLVPISMHAMVELPFFLSSLHWILWLFFIFLPLKHYCKSRRVRVSKMAITCLQSLVFIAPVYVAYFLVDTSLSLAEILKYKNKAGVNFQLPNRAFKNLYFSSYAAELFMRKRLHQGIAANNGRVVREVVKWTKKEVDQSPRIKLYENLINAYAFLEEDEQLCKALDEAAFLYPKNTVLSKKIDEECVYDSF